MINSGQKNLILKLVGAWGVRYLGFLVMTIMAVWSEARPAPGLPDAIIDRVPFVDWVSGWNYYLWIIAWAPLTIWLLCCRPLRAYRLLLAGGILSVIRGLCIMATGLGPPRGEDINAGMSAADRLAGIWAVANPFSALVEDSAFVYLSKDLFFSGHVATTFLVVLYVWPKKSLRVWALIAHFLVTASVFLSHLHYTIDVIGAYAITFAMFVLMEKDPRLSTEDDLGPRWSEIT
ncbi:MAG: hypothetical protein ACI97A_003048 [Planctomycetota bacterium]|jgi:hypothetical protein